MAPNTHFPKDRIVSGRALIMIGQRRAVGAGHRPRRAHSRAHHKEQVQQRRAQGQQPPEQGQFHGISGLQPGLGASHVRD